MTELIDEVNEDVYPQFRDLEKTTFKPSKLATKFYYDPKIPDWLLGFYYSCQDEETYVGSSPRTIYHELHRRNVKISHTRAIHVYLDGLLKLIQNSHEHEDLQTEALGVLCHKVSKLVGEYYFQPKYNMFRGDKNP